MKATKFHNDGDSTKNSGIERPTSNNRVIVQSTQSQETTPVVSRTQWVSAQYGQSIN